MACANGIWIWSTYTGTQLDNICTKMVAANINLLYIRMATWSGGRLSQVVNDATIQSMVNTVRKYPSLKILCYIYQSQFPENISNYTQRIADCVAFVNKTGVDGINDDIEDFGGASGQTILNLYNGMKAAMPAGKLVTLARTVGNIGAPYYDEIVYPGLKVDVVIPMLYNGGSYANYANNYFDWQLTHTQSPVSIGIRPSTQGMSNIISVTNNIISGKNYQYLAGYSIWAYDQNSPVSSGDWNLWNAWPAKNCTPGPNPTLTTITISPASTSIGINGSIQLSAVCKDQNGANMTCPTLSWVSSDPSKVAVNTSGMVVGIATGVANITAKSGSIVSNTSVITVTSTPLPTGNLLLNPGFETGTSGNPDNWIMKTSEGVLTAFSFIYPEVGRNPTEKSVAIQRVIANSAWAYWLQIVNLDTLIPSYKLSGWIKTQNVTSNNNGAYIQIDWFSSTGYISTSFSQKITGTENWTYVDVTAPPPSGATRAEIALVLNSTGVGDKVWFDDIYFGNSTSSPTLTTIVTSPQTASINVGGTQQLIATCKDQNNNTMACSTLTWVSSNTDVATVNSAGVVTGISGGVVNITASTSGKTSNPPSVITVTTIPSDKKFAIYDVLDDTNAKKGVMVIQDDLGAFNKDQACVEVCNKLGQL
jgi:hypothetical protein